VNRYIYTKTNKHVWFNYFYERRRIFWTRNCVCYFGFTVCVLYLNECLIKWCNFQRTCSRYIVFFIYLAKKNVLSTNAQACIVTFFSNHYANVTLSVTSLSAVGVLWILFTIFLLIHILYIMVIMQTSTIIHSIWFTT